MNDRRRPQAPCQPPTKATTSSVAQATDLALMPRPEWDVYLRGYCDGYRDGIDLGRRQMDEELATLQREAHKVVMALAGLDSHTERQSRRRQRQKEVGDHRAGAAQAWPAEATS